MIWIIGISIAVAVGLGLGYLAFLINKKINKYQAAANVIENELVVVGAVWMQKLLAHFVVGDAGKAHAMIEDVIARPDTKEFLMKEVWTPIHDYVEAQKKEVGVK